MEALLTMLLSEKYAALAGEAPAPRSAEADLMRQQIYESLKKPIAETDSKSKP
jgi:hypothetical protein